MLIAIDRKTGESLVVPKGWEEVWKRWYEEKPVSRLKQVAMLKEVDETLAERVK